jgi:hypothetical protein
MFSVDKRERLKVKSIVEEIQTLQKKEHIQWM